MVAWVLIFGWEGCLGGFFGLGWLLAGWFSVGMVAWVLVFRLGRLLGCGFLDLMRFGMVVWTRVFGWDDCLDVVWFLVLLWLSMRD